jgi:hypothetical protein
MNVDLDLEALKQQLASIEHERWASWQRWMHDQCGALPGSGGALMIPAALVERWERQIVTPYEQLSEAEQRSDMEQVDRYWPLIAPALERAERVEKAAQAIRALWQSKPGGAEVGDLWELLDQLCAALAATPGDIRCAECGRGMREGEKIACRYDEFLCEDCVAATPGGES